MFGPHLMMDGYGCNKRKLMNMSYVYKFLDRFPELIGMTKIMPPYAFTYSGLKPEDWGISGVVLIAESHISLHTFPEKNYFSADVFSCKDFDVDSAIEYIATAFDAENYEKNIVMRGSHFPKDMMKAAEIVRTQRIQKQR